MKTGSSPVQWNLPPSELELTPGEIQVWRIDPGLRAKVEDFRPYLSPDELERAERYYFSTDRDFYIIRRGVLRLVLAGYLKISAGDVLFNYTAYQKPELADHLGGGQIHFNLTHSRDLALLAVAVCQPIGIDVEYMDPNRADQRVAQQFFAPGEIEILKQLEEPDWIKGFFNCWTRKEAYVKALGEGLSHPLNQFEVSVRPEQAAALIKCDRDLKEHTQWSMLAFEPDLNYAGALAFRGQIGSIQFWKVEWPE